MKASKTHKQTSKAHNAASFAQQTFTVKMLASFDVFVWCAVAFQLACM